MLGAGIIFLLVTCMTFGGLLFGYAGIAAALPNPDELEARANTFASTQIFDRQGNLLNEIADPSHGRRTMVMVDEISKNLKDATIATEDPNFYQHPGVDPVGMARALYYAVRDRDLLSGPGGSTIPQQLVKLTFLSSERTLSRKLKEAILSAEITRRYSKDTVLQIYLNEIYYGNLAYGIEAGSETYFGSHAKDLDLAEASMLAGLPQAPAYYDPYTKLWNADGTPGVVKKRQGVVLGLMVKHGYISSDLADAAYKEPLKLRPLQQSYTMEHPHFVLYVRDLVEKQIGPELMSKGGLRIYTTLDPKIQAAAEDEVAKQVAKLQAQGQNATDGALVAVRPATGEVLAMVGSADFHNDEISGQINMAVAPRQPGSSIKPITYLAAFEMPAVPAPKDATPASDAFSAVEAPGGWTPSTVIMDVKTQFPDGANPPYIPGNYDGKEHGLVTVRSALANSYNIPAVKTLEHVGLDRLKDMAGRLGITTLTRPDYGLSLTLGGGEVTLLEMTGAYATLANGGVRAPLTPIACIIGPDGKLVWGGAAAGAVQGCQAASKQPGAAPLVTPAPAQPVVDAQYAYEVTSILSDKEARRPAFGAAAETLSLPDRPSVAKTGTTNDYRDAWTLGYTPDLAIGVWVGNADYKPMKQTAGSVGAAPIWQNVMRRSLEGTPGRAFTEPQGIQHLEVCADTGTLPSEACPNRRQEVFAAGHGPLPARFDLHQRLRIDKVTGLLATESTPPDRVETRDVMVFPARYQKWAEAHGMPQLNLEQPKYAFQPELELKGPVDGSQVGGIVQVTGRAHLPEPLVWRVEYGVGPSPIGWGTLTGQKQGDVDGWLVDWDVPAYVSKHDGAGDFSLRLAAYDPQRPQNPVAVSNAVHVIVEAPTPTPSPTLEPSPTPADTSTPTPEATATDTPAPADTPTPLPPGPTDTPQPVEPTATPAGATSTATATPGGQATTPVEAAITQPLPNVQVSGAVPINGIAAGSRFHSYWLQYAPGIRPAPKAWKEVAALQFQPAPALGDLLGIWDTTALAPGPYSLRLIVYDTNGQAVVAQVIVEVVAP